MLDRRLLFSLFIELRNPAQQEQKMLIEKIVAKLELASKIPATTKAEAFFKAHTLRQLRTELTSAIKVLEAAEAVPPAAPPAPPSPPVKG